MAFEEMWGVLDLIIRFAIILFPMVYLLDAIRKRLQPKKMLHEAALVFCMSLLLSAAFYPFFLALIEYTVSLEVGVAVEYDMLLFGSDIATYLVVLLTTFLIYLFVFNKTKE